MRQARHERNALWISSLESLPLEFSDQRDDLLFKDLRRHRTNVLLGDTAVLRDHKRLWYAVDTPINRHTAIDIGARARVGVAHCIEPSCSVVGLVLVVESM